MAAGRSISVHSAPRTSPERAAVKTRKLEGQLHRPGSARTLHGADGRGHLPVVKRLHVLNQVLLRAQHRPRCGRRGYLRGTPMATAHSITAAMRWRNRRAVAGRWCQTPRSASSTSAVVISRTGRRPRRG